MSFGKKKHSLFIFIFFKQEELSPYVLIMDELHNIFLPYYLIVYQL